MKAYERAKSTNISYIEKSNVIQFLLNIYEGGDGVNRINISQFSIIFIVLHFYISIFKII
jgi:hypothetical protein